MTLSQLLRSNWSAIRSRKQLHNRLRASASRLRELGHVNLACDWERRLLRMPSCMEKEAINYVLVTACLELDNYGIND